MLRLAVLEYSKPLNHKRVSPLEQYKEINPALGILIDRGKIKYSLSIKNLTDAGAVVAIQQNFLGRQVLSLENLSLTSLDGLQEVANLPSLRWLYLSSNQLKEFAPGVFANLPSLQELDLGGNQLKELTPGVFANLRSLQSLNLEFNQLEGLVPGVFLNLPVLKSLYLSNNKLKKISPEALESLPKLELLDLEDNSLEELVPEFFLSLQALKSLYLCGTQLTSTVQAEALLKRLLKKVNLFRREKQIEEIVAAGDVELSSRLQRSTERVVQFGQDHSLIIAAGVGALAVGAVIVARDPIKARQLVRQAGVRAHDNCVIS